ncbi:hypothetical protein RKE25_11750 [Dyella sp. BiH032]|uniref:hypothetical protein n=1 Tax=Dyella sp. BiH032 TaxID=3075430 RepID=UPI0028935069|nr:hypothetical protein [Dyella sp. BiH032]WNL44104.1 hypothetical protein RKE25_11750 [Dyella sp. BiH032]
MQELPIVALVHDEKGDVERAAGRLRATGLRNPMVHTRGLDDLTAWHTRHAGEIAFMIVHADTCRAAGDGDGAVARLPVYPAFVVETVEGRLMASMRLSPGVTGMPATPFDAHTVVRSLHMLGLRWLVV